MKSMLNYFVTGTDTGVGKSFVTCALLLKLRAQGLRVCGYKPVAAGAEYVDGELSNEDARALLAASSPGLQLAEINPLCLPDACSPHIAAQRAGCTIELPALLSAYQSLAVRHDALIVEGAGGFLVPLSDSLDFALVAQALALPVILVVGMRLGCLNHALLSAEAIRARGLVLAGWVANILDPHMPFLQENIETLRQRLAAPCLGVLPRLDSPLQALERLQLP